MLNDGVPATMPSFDEAAAKSDGLGCPAGAHEMRRAAEEAGKSETLQRYAADYPLGPHDQPQSMCPAFGSLRVGLRMRRTATVLSGSACCVYGLTFTSHFYGARRSVGYVPFNSETLVTGKLFEDIREAVHKLADPALYDAVVIINLCVPTASGVPLQLLPNEIDGVRIIGIDVPGFGVPTHAEAKDVLAGAMLRYARNEAEQGPVQAPRGGKADKPTVTLVGEMFPADPIGIGALLEPLGLAAGPVVPTREWRELYSALDCAVVAAIHPFYTASFREFEVAGRPIVGSAPVGRDGTAAWLEAKGVAVTYRASLEQDLAAVQEFKPDLAIGTRPVVLKAKEMAIPALYFTNLISARPLMGPAGAGSLAQVVNAALAAKPRFDAMKEFFEGVGEGHAAGIWQEVPQDRPEFRSEYKRRLDKDAKKRKAEEMV
ncbi:MAG TPA: chlorophyllide a reductase subunit Y [Methyloceanibacter sp.]